MAKPRQGRIPPPDQPAGKPGSRPPRVVGFLASGDPPQLARLVVGKPPGATVKLCLRHWGIVILSSRVGLGEKPLREGCSPVVRHRVVRAGQGDDDLVVQHFDVKFVIGVMSEATTKGRRPKPTPPDA